MDKQEALSLREHLVREAIDLDAASNSEYRRGIVELIMRATWHADNDGEDPGDGMLHSALDTLIKGAPVYTKCADCHLFVEANYPPDVENGAAPYVHLHRGDEHDEALDATHEARAGQSASLDWWKQYGPYEMKARFVS